MKGTYSMLICSLITVNVGNCFKESSQPTNPNEILNITGHWIYSAVFAQGDSTWYLEPAEAESSNFKITSSGSNLEGVFDRSVLRLCTDQGCIDSNSIARIIIEGGIDSGNNLNFDFKEVDTIIITHTGLVNVIRTDLPPGAPLRMRMNGTATVGKNIGNLPTNIKGFFSADRLIYR